MMEAMPLATSHTQAPSQATVSAIVPTIGRPEFLRKLLTSLANQTHRPDEIIVADGSSTQETFMVLQDPTWEKQGLLVKHLRVVPPHAVRQRQQAIALATGDFLFLLDDDVILEPACLEQLYRLLQADPGTVAVMADFNNQSWPRPTRLWEWYLRFGLGLHEGQWQGKVLGPLLRFGYHPTPIFPQPMQWLGTNMTLVRRQAYEAVGGFSNFFAYRSTINEDVDLGIKISRVGSILFCPMARLGHFHAPGGRLSPALAAEDDLRNRYAILHRTVGYRKRQALMLVLLYAFIESFAELRVSLMRLSPAKPAQRSWGRFKAMLTIVQDLWQPAPNPRKF